MNDLDSPGSHRRRRTGSPRSPRSSPRRHHSRSRRSSSPKRSHRSRRSRSKSEERTPMSPSRRSDGFQYTKGMNSPPGSPAGSVGGMSASSKGYPSFDARDNAPEDTKMYHDGPYGRMTPMSPGGGHHGNPRTAPMVRGSLRLEGVDFSKYEGLKNQPDVQRLFTTALRDDLISEAGNGMTRDDILLKLTPGPIKTVVLDYGDAAKPSRAAPTLIDAEWSMDVEYAISARSDAAQVKIAKALYESLSNQEFDVRATRAAYLKYINKNVENPWKIQAVPCSRQNEPSIRYADQQRREVDSYYSPQASKNVFGGHYDRASPSGGSSVTGSPHSQHSNALSPMRSSGY